MRIVEAPGKRPFLRNLDAGLVTQFRRYVEVIDLIGVTAPARLREALHACAQRDPGPAEAAAEHRRVETVQGYVPQRMVPDRAGYFVVYPDYTRGVLLLEHYRSDGVLHVTIEGRTAAELYTPAIERHLLGRLDHAAYLGRELARAEQALWSGEDYTQDGAPEQAPDR